MPRRSLAQLYKEEFRNYSFVKFQQDSLAGLTVAAVALSLALAFGVASGSTASAGLVTAILAGFVIGASDEAIVEAEQRECKFCKEGEIYGEEIFN